MKIYYKIPDKESDIEKEAHKAFEHLPDEYKEPGELIEKMIANLYKEKLQFFFELLKYKVKWSLRYIETEVEKESGMIIINDTGGVDVEGFSPNLTELIVNEIDSRFER